MLAPGGYKRGEGDPGKDDRSWPRRHWMGLSIATMSVATVAAIALPSRRTAQYPIRLPAGFAEDPNEKPGNRVFIGPASEAGQVDCGGEPMLDFMGSKVVGTTGAVAGRHVIQLSGGRAAVVCMSPQEQLPIQHRNLK